MSPVVEEIVSEVEKPEALEQQILLTRLRVKQLKIQGIINAANPPVDLCPLTMEEIDFYKHEALRKMRVNKFVLGTNI